MPVLAAYFGPSGANFLVEHVPEVIKPVKPVKARRGKKTQIQAQAQAQDAAVSVPTTPVKIDFQANDKARSFDFYYYPFAYHANLFSHYVSEENYYKQLFDFFVKDTKLKLTSYDVYVTNTGSKPLVSAKHFMPFDKILSSVSNFFPLFVNNDTVFTRDGVTYTDYSQVLESISSKNLPGIEDPNSNFFANLSIYSQLKNADFVAQVSIDQTLIYSALSKLTAGYIQTNDAVLFSGGRFFGSTSAKEYDTTFLVDFIQGPGIVPIYLDKKNAAILLNFVNSLSESSEIIGINAFLDCIGSVVRFEGSFECALTTELGSTQVFDVEENSVYVVPIDAGTAAHIQMKNKKSGEFLDKFVYGGSLGIIFNTLPYGRFISSDRKLLNDVIRQFSEALSKI